MRNPVARITGGKGQVYDECVNDFNIDIESGICSSTLNSKGESDKNRACAYCYASYLFKNNSYRVKEIKESEFAKIASKYPAHLLRIGKSADCGHSRTRNELKQILQYCIKYKMRPIVTTKLLEYDQEVSDLVKQAAGIVHISLGKDEDEPGAVALGATNVWRLAQALKYKRNGCPTQARLVADITQPLSKFHQKAVNLMGNNGVVVTPLHYTNKSHFASMRRDITWDEAKSRGYFSYSHGDLRPNFFHKDWEKLKERCGPVDGKLHCNNCVGKINFNKKTYKAKLKKLGWSLK